MIARCICGNFLDTDSGVCSKCTKKFLVIFFIVFFALLGFMLWH